MPDRLTSLFETFSVAGILKAIGALLIASMVWQAKSDDITTIKETLLELKSKMGIVETSQHDIDKRLSRIEGRLENK